VRTPKSVKSLEDFGRIRLSNSFFMREFLYSEISQIEQIPNLPEQPDHVIKVGRRLCEEVLEPIQEGLGRVAIRSAYRSPAVNAKGAENRNQYNCSSNESNYGGHIWDFPATDGAKGATACIVVPSFLDYYERTAHWQALAWWVHDNVPGYSSMYFFPKLAAFNVTWSEKPKKRINSYITPRGCLTNPEKSNFEGSHQSEYRDFLSQIET
jgi:hypothetical protein